MQAGLRHGCVPCHIKNFLCSENVLIGYTIYFFNNLICLGWLLACLSVSCLLMVDVRYFYLLNVQHCCRNAKNIHHPLAVSNFIFMLD